MCSASPATPHFKPAEVKRRDGSPAKNLQRFSRKTIGVAPAADTSSAAKSLPAGLKFQPCTESRSGAAAEPERSGGPTKDDIGLYVLGDDAQGASIMWLSHSIRPDSKHFHVRITIYP